MADLTGRERVPSLGDPSGLNGQIIAWESDLSALVHHVYGSIGKEVALIERRRD
jgi:hypothetical protein